MRVHQYVYFALFSRELSAMEMARRLGVDPDEVVTKGSRQSDPERPVSHVWRVVCRKPRMRVDEQMAEVVGRLMPHVGRISELAAELVADDPEHGGARLSVVRFFEREDGEEEELSSPEKVLQKLPGQHQLLGWMLEPQTMRFLLATDACVDVDEYG